MEQTWGPGAARYRLGDYRDYVPPPSLSTVGEGVWTHRVAVNVALPGGAMHRVLPDPALSIALRCRRDAAGRCTGNGGPRPKRPIPTDPRRANVDLHLGEERAPMPHFVRPRWAAVAAALLFASGSPAAAQVRDSTARLERIGDGVYAIIHDDATDAWPHGNTGVVVGRDGVLVVDATYLPSRARADIALIRKVTDKPVRWLVNTHWHFDHNNGAAAYTRAFPGLTVVSERETRAWIVINQTYWARMSTAPASARRADLAALERQLATGRDSAGAALNDEVKRRLPRTVAQRRNELEELASLEVVTPNLVFDQALALDLGGRRVVLEDRGRANSPHDVTVYLPVERILFTGDILVQSPLPYSGASWPVPWAGVLRELEGIPIAAMVPGHGPVMRDHGYTRQVRMLMEAVTARVDSMARRGLTLDQVQAAMNLDDVRRACPPWQGAQHDEDWKLTVTTLTERAWRGVRGQG
jgi:glyoxylase-like metal-dependent hydrolase (beta-lactamase superfamily II)